MDFGNQIRRGIKGGERQSTFVPSRLYLASQREFSLPFNCVNVASGFWFMG